VRTLKIFLYGFLILLIAVFIIQNYGTLTYSVSLRLSLGFLALESMPLPFFLIVPLIFFAGVLLATLIGFPERRRLSRELKTAQAALQNAGLKKSPLTAAGLDHSSDDEPMIRPPKEKTPPRR
jgi:uncharacterized integral membrane protein